MKKILFLLITVLCFTLSGCDNDDWSNGDPAMESIYYYGFQDWGKQKNDVVFNMKQGETLGIPVQFHCEFIRSYDVTTDYYTTVAPKGAQLVCGTDYEVTDEKGNVLTPNSNGAFSMTWPNAKKGIQNIYIKALSNKVGSFLVQTFDPKKKIDADDLSSTTNNLTAQYEVRAFSQNYFVTVNIK